MTEKKKTFDSNVIARVHAAQREYLNQDLRIVPNADDHRRWLESLPETIREEVKNKPLSEVSTWRSFRAHYLAPLVGPLVTFLKTRLSDEEWECYQWMEENKPK